ncbi:MAG: PilW family protein [Myxococcota bacterium]
MARVRNIHKSEAGFTIIELIATSAMALVVFSSLFGAMIAQQQSYAVQMDSSEASQNARAALSIMKTELRMAGWGIDGFSGTGFPVVGLCNNTADSTECNNLPTVGDASRTSDRLRVVHMSTGHFDDLTSVEGGTFRARSHRRALYTADEAPAIAEGSYAMIDGECQDNTRFTGVMAVDREVSDTDYWHKYEFVAPAAGIPTPPCTDIRDGYRISESRIIDYYIDRSEESPRLMRHLNPGAEDSAGVPTSAEVVAYGVDSLQIQYGIDVGSSSTDDRPDQQVDTWCDDLTNCDTSTLSGSTFTTLELAARTVAIRLAIVSAAPTSSEAEATDFDVFDETIPPDGLRRWVFRGAVRLRNNEIL